MTQMTESFRAYANAFAAEIALDNESTNRLHHIWTAEGNNAAFDALVNGHMRLVLKIANDYAWYSDFEDIVSEGAVGLMTALRNYTPEKGAFAPYAVLYIKHYICEFLNKSRAVKMARPDRMTEEEKAVKNLFESLNEKIGDGETEFAQTLVSDCKTPSELAESAADAEVVRKIMAEVLNKQEIAVIANRYAAEPLTLQELADKFFITRERVRQIEVAALKKLRRRLDLELQYEEEQMAAAQEAARKRKEMAEANHRNG